MVSYRLVKKISLRWYDTSTIKNNTMPKGRLFTQWKEWTRCDLNKHNTLRNIHRPTINRRAMPTKAAKLA